MFCTKCGSEIKEGTLFCTKCGTRIEVPVNKKSGVNPLIIVLIAIVTVLILGGITAAASYFIINNDKTAFEEDDEDERDDTDYDDEEAKEEKNGGKHGFGIGKEDENDGDETTEAEVVSLNEYAHSLNLLAGSVYSRYLSANDYNPDYTYKDTIEGTIDYVIDDFDGDGDDELLRVDVRNSNDVYICISEFSEEKGIYDVAEKAICNIFIGDLGQEDIFSYSYNGTRYIGVAENALSYMFGDGEWVSYIVWKYENEQLVEIAKDSYAGSEGIDDNGFSAGCRSIGIPVDWNMIFGGRKSIADYAQNGTMIARVYVEGWSYWSHGGTFPVTQFGNLYLGGYSDANKAEFSNKNARTADGGLSEYIIPDSNTRYLTNDDLYGLTEWECRVARNEILARHGRKFKDSQLQEYFNSKSWYFGTIEPDKFNENVLSDIERDNMYMIKAFENNNF